MITRTRFVRRPAACPWPTTLAGVALAAWLGSASAAVFDFRVDRGLQLLRVNMRRAAAGEISVRARFHDTAAPDPLARLHVTAVLGHEDEGAAGRCASAAALGCERKGAIRVGCP